MMKNPIQRLFTFFSHDLWIMDRSASGRLRAFLIDVLRIATRQGVCQDFTHITIALVRRLGVPCRYVSGYLVQPSDGTAVRSSGGATHAWLEAWLPALGWIGFDPTNDLLADARQVRVAVGRDDADVPPTRGVFKGVSAVSSEPAVAVRVASVHVGSGDEAATFGPWASQETRTVQTHDDTAQQQ